jgi:hypothetical protein
MKVQEQYLLENDSQYSNSQMGEVTFIETEQDNEGNPESRKKEWKNGIYDKNELYINKPIKLSIKNIKMLLENTKNGRRFDRRISSIKLFFII